MPKFSKHSERELSQAHPDLQMIMRIAILFYDFMVIESHRGKEKQNKAYREKYSKLKWPDSKHNKLPSEAVDIIPWPTKYADIKAFYFMAGMIILLAEVLYKLGIIKHKIRWGGDWNQNKVLNDQKFYDLAHFEIITK